MFLAFPLLVSADGGAITTRDIHATHGHPSHKTPHGTGGDASRIGAALSDCPRPRWCQRTQHTRPPTAEATATRMHGGRRRGGWGAAILVYGTAGGHEGSPWSLCAW